MDWESRPLHCAVCRAGGGILLAVLGRCLAWSVVSCGDGRGFRALLHGRPEKHGEIFRNRGRIFRNCGEFFGNCGEIHAGFRHHHNIFCKISYTSCTIMEKFLYTLAISVVGWRVGWPKTCRIIQHRAAFSLQNVCDATAHFYRMKHHFTKFCRETLNL